MVRTLLFLLFDFAVQIASICVVHNNAQLAFLGLVDLFEPDDIRMI